jgi:thiol-disulfide isomerase/thioredoxin
VKRTSVLLCLLTLLLGVVFAAPSSAQFMTAGPKLEIGSEAPPLKITEWIKGEPADMAKDKGKKAYLFEFWAVWCQPCVLTIPHLSEMQEKYPNDLVVIGVTAKDPNNRLKQVRRFIEAQGDKIKYRIAWDEKAETTSAYTSQAAGIPYAVLVDKQGRVAWAGAPLIGAGNRTMMDPTLSNTLKQVVSGNYDPVTAKKRNETFQELARMMPIWMRSGQFDKARDRLFEAADVDPSNEQYLGAIFGLYRDQFQDPAGLRTWLEGFIGRHGDDAASMFALTRVTLQRNTPWAFRNPDLIMPVAKHAYEKLGAEQVDVVEAYARSRAIIGDFEQAIALQRKVLERAEGEGPRKEARALLDYFESCKRLRDTEAKTASGS